jgi:KAP family P-loop domain
MDDLNRLIESYNPFDRSLVVRTHDVWEPSFPDVPSINSHISDSVLQGIDQIQSGQRSVLGITIKAEKGLGKTHLISRLRRDLRMRDDTFFVYMSETDYTDLDRINSMFLECLAMSLKQKGSQEFTQWQELSTLLLNQAYGSSYSTDVIVKKISVALANDPSLVDKLTAKICQLKPDLKDPYVAQAILWTLSERSLFAINWLAGRSLSQAQADAMGLPMLEDSDREARALGTASQVLDLIGDYRTVVICLDEVEPKNCNSNGLTTPQVVALLAKDLYSKIKRGILMMAIFPQTWMHQIKVMPQANSVIDRIGEKVFDLQYLNSDDVVELLSTWLAEFYAQKELTPPTPTYPFHEDELRELGKEHPIVRRVLQWCCENWNVTPPPSDNLHHVEIAFNEQLLALDGNIDDCLDDSDLIAEALRLGFKSLEGSKVGPFVIEEIQNIDTKAVDKGYLNFRIVGTDNHKPFKVGVSVLQESTAKYVSAALKRLIDYKKFDFTRGCLIRSKEIKRHTHGYQYCNTLLKDLGGEWVSFKSKDLQSLLAILNVFNAYEDYEITQEKVLDFMRQRKIAENNDLIHEILSDPSGQIPDDVVDEDQLLTLNISAKDSDVNDVLPLLT